MRAACGDRSRSVSPAAESPCQGPWWGTSVALSPLCLSATFEPAAGARHRPIRLRCLTLAETRRRGRRSGERRDVAALVLDHGDERIDRDLAPLRATAPLKLGPDLFPRHALAIRPGAGHRVVRIR